ncbi:hypothetical protein LC607_23195 [Nostoc sp. CHAB 5824]|nr:hypothetical protein [Nostoc sp. CHAB 5824]
MRRRNSKSYSTYVRNFPHLNTFWMPESLDKYGIPNLQKALIEPDEL